MHIQHCGRGFSLKYIRELQSRIGNDPALLERVIYAFGLLEAIRRVGLPFCFKGGTTLMLLLEHPRRLSTDIDIIVEQGTDIDDYIRREVTILLDVLFEELKYSSVVEKPIRNELLLTEGENLAVRIPDAKGLLGDKLTAFAPNTTGVPFGVDKELEIIKQLFDCAALFDAVTDFAEVKKAYDQIVRSEMKYRGLSVLREESSDC